MIVSDDGIPYKVLGSELKFYADETAYGWNVVVEYNEKYHYLGSEPINIQVAVSFWQEQNNRMLSQDELKQVMLDNHLIM